MTPEDLKLAHLKENPFRLEPQDKVRVWAGHHDLEKTLENIVTIVRNDKVGISEFVVLHGEFGTGKSHALRYLRTRIEDEKPEEFRAKCIYLETLRIADKVAFLDIYRTVIERIGRTDFHEFAIRLIERVNTEFESLKQALPDKVFKQAAIRDEDTLGRLKSQAIEKVLGRFAPKFPLWEQLAEDSGDAWFYISASKQKIDGRVLSRLGSTAPIASDFEAISHLGMIVNLTCGLDTVEGAPYWRAFYLFVDEVEVMVDLEPKAIQALNQSFRDFLNACPEHLCLMFGMTGDAAFVEMLFALALLGRMTHPPIQIPTLDTDQALDFLKDVLRYSRPSKEEGDPWHPFQKAALQYIIENTTDKTPRNLFRACRTVLELASDEGILKKGAKISRADAETLLV